MRILVAQLMMLAVLPLWSQVGVNTESPNQALDVNGKVKIGNDGTTPTEGTLRYGSTGDFEGFTSDGWQSLTNSSSSIVPGNVTPLTGFATISPGVVQDFTLYDAFTLTSYANVPSGKYFMLTSVLITSNTLGTSGNHYLRIGPRVTTTYPITYRSLDLTGDRLNGSQFLTDPNGFLVVVRPGEKFSIHNSSSSAYPLDITVRGYLLEPQ